MPQNRHHFLTLAVFAPAQVVVHIFGTEAQLFRRGENMVKASAHFQAIGRALFGVSLNTRDTQVFLQTGEKLRLHRKNTFVKIHRPTSGK